MAGGLTIILAATPRVELHAQLDALRQDSRFIFDAASSNLMEIRLGQLAQSKATNQAVKQFGQQMVTDHTTLENQLTATVSRGNTQFKPGMTDDHEKEVERLEKLSGTEFDQQYMTAMVAHHQKDVATFQSQSQSARSTEARQIVAAGLPVLQRHLTMATQLASQVGVNAGVATTPTQNPPVTTQNPPVATQPGTVTTQTSTQFNADMPFVRMAASSNMMEIRLGQLAQSKGSNQAVKQFGQRMVTDHNQMQQQLMSTASSVGQTLTPTLNPQHTAEVSRLQGLSGQEFDRAYMTAMIRAHQQDVNEFQARSQSANSTQIRSLASSSLPMLQQHLSLAVQVGNQVGADSTTVVAGPNNPNRPDDDRNRGNVRADAEFIRDVGAGNTMQIQLAELARDKAKNSAVRNYAERELEDHTRLQRQWENMANNNGFPLKEGMGSNHREKVEQLRKANSNNFDRTYMTIMIQQHQDVVSYWQKEGRASKSPQVRALVSRGLSTIEQHLAEAKQVGRQVGVDPEKALKNRKDVARNKNKDRDD
jgi:putative membrane protein